MQRHVIEGPINDEMLNKENHNFKVLFDDRASLQKQLDDLIIEDGLSNAEVVQARDGEPLLKDRLNKVDQQIDSTNQQMAEKANTSYVETLMSNITDGSPKELFYSFSALTTKYPNGTTGPMLVMDPSFEDGAHSFIWNGAKWEDIGLYQSDGIAEGSVTPKETSFITHKKSRNLFNKNTVTFGKSLQPDGSISDNPDGSISEYIPIKPSTLYINSHIINVHFFTVDKTFISFKGLPANVAYKTPSNAYYVRIRVSNTMRESLQYEEGGVSTAYESYFDYWELDDMITIKNESAIGDYYTTAQYRVDGLTDTVHNFSPSIMELEVTNKNPFCGVIIAINDGRTFEISAGKRTTITAKSIKKLTLRSKLIPINIDIFGGD